MKKRDKSLIISDFFSRFWKIGRSSRMANREFNEKNSLSYITFFGSSTSEYYLYSAVLTWLVPIGQTSTWHVPIGRSRSPDLAPSIRRPRILAPEYIEYTLVLQCISVTTWFCQKWSGSSIHLPQYILLVDALGFWLFFFSSWVYIKTSSLLVTASWMNLRAEILRAVNDH